MRKQVSSKKPQRTLLGHAPNKQLGQNFLVDQSILNEIVACISPQPNDFMIEIGPGLGALTEVLLPKLDRLWVVELDAGLAKRLERYEKLTVFQEDVLQFDFAKVFEQAPSQPLLRVVGNLPYQISSPLLFYLMNWADRIKDQHFLLQKEVVDRIVSKPGHKAYGRLSVMLQYRYQVDDLLDVPPESFFPPPKVNSAVVQLIPKPLDQLHCVNVAHLQFLVALAFSQRRKMLRNPFKALPSEFNPQDIDFTLDRRAEEVCAEEYVNLANYYTDFLSYKKSTD